MATVLTGQGCCSPHPFKHHPSGPLASSAVIRPLPCLPLGLCSEPFPFPPAPVASLSWLAALFRGKERVRRLPGRCWCAEEMIRKPGTTHGGAGSEAAAFCLAPLCTQRLMEGVGQGLACQSALNLILGSGCGGGGRQQRVPSRGGLIESPCPKFHGQL